MTGDMFSNCLHYKIIVTWRLNSDLLACAFINVGRNAMVAHMLVALHIIYLFWCNKYVAVIYWQVNVNEQNFHSCAKAFYHYKLNQKWNLFVGVSA